MSGTRYARSGAAVSGPVMVRVNYGQVLSRVLPPLQSRASKARVALPQSGPSPSRSSDLSPFMPPTPRPRSPDPTTYSDAHDARARITAIMAFSVRCAAQQPHHLGGLVCAATATVLGLCALLRDAQRTGNDPRVRARGIGCRSCRSAPPGLCSRAAKSPPGAHRPAQMAASHSAAAAAVAGEQAELACAFVLAAGAQHPQARRAPPGEL